MAHSVDFIIYKKYNPDLQHLSGKDLEFHWQHHGIHEGRIHNLQTLIQKSEHLLYFDVDYYIKKNTHLKFENKTDYTIDYLENRLNDGLDINEQLTTFKKKSKRFTFHF